MRERNKVWVTEGSRRSYAENRYGQQSAMTLATQRRERKRTNWRDVSDFCSFYFKGFLEMGEKDLWFEFKKWGDVREVFIAKKKNRSGRKYGFVRFKGVVDMGMLERQLDNMIIGGLKLYATGQKG